MDYYSKFMHELARDIEADRKGLIVFVELDGSALYLPGTNNEGFEKHLSNLGVKFEKKFIHTYKVLEYPNEFEFTSEMAKDMAYQLWGLEST